MSSTTIGFGNQGVGTSSAPLTATLTNVGNATLTLSSIQVTGSNAGDFSLTNNCGSSLAPSAQCALAVTFAPSAAGTRTASVVFTDNAASSPQTLNLTGTGTAPAVGLSATTLTFGGQLVGTSSPAQTLTLTNNGNSALGITSLVVTGANPGDFPETTTCGSSVAAGGSCAISVTFTPTAPGSRAATVTIADNASGSPQTVNLTGTGTSPVVSLTVNGLTFGSQNLGTTSAPQSVTLSNTGNALLSISGVALTGANPGDFTETANCGTSVPAGGNCTITVTFTPASAGTRTASVMITDNASDSPQMIGLTGTGVGSAAVASLSPSSLTFGSQPVATTSASLAVALSNTGNLVLTITGIAFSGADPGDYGETNTCGSSVAAGGSCTISVTFTPTAPGTRTAVLTVTDNSNNVAGSTQNVSLTGTGTTSAVGLSATTLTFASQAVGTPSAAQTVILTNTGNASLTIMSISVTGANAGDFAQSNTCGSGVAANGSCTINVTFTPTAPGTRTATMIITDNANNVAGSAQSVGLAGTGSGPAITLSPSSLTFGSQSIGVASPAQSVTLSNTGNATLSITSISATGANPEDFSVTNTCGSSVAAGSNCRISVTFTPAVAGTRTAAVSISDNAASSPQTVGLTGTGISGQVALSPSNLTFASQNVGTTSAAQTTTLSNTGSASFNITSISITGPNAGDFSETNNCGSSLAQGANCTIQVTFTPTAPLIRTASISIADNLTGSPQTVSLTGTGSAPLASLTATSLTFGSQNLGSTSAAQTFTLNNTGNLALTVTGIAFSGADPGDYGETNTCGSSVAASGSCTISVTFTPAATGTRTAALTITDNSNNVAGSTQTVNLTGTGTGPVASVTPSTLAFGNQTLNSTSTAQSITLANTGNASLTIASISLTGTNAGDFAQSNTCGSSVAASGSCTISVTFTPAATGPRTATLTLADNSNNVAGSAQTVNLTGTGTASIVSLSVGSLSFGNQAVNTTSPSQTVTLTNTGNVSLTITSISITGANSADFSQTNTCGGSVAAGGSCNIIVTFTPSASGTRTASASIADNATAGSPQTVSLTGTGTSITVGLSATALTFGNQAVGTTSAAQVVTLTNEGNSTVTISSIQVTGANSGDFGQSNNCGSSVAVSGSCTINVTFSPTAPGSRSATLTVNDNASGSPQTASLSGTGTAPAASLSPTSFAFGSQPAATSSSAQTFTLSNTGNATLDIASIGFTGTNASDFSQTATCRATLAANSSCTIAVVFTPPASGSRSASLTVTDNSNGVSASTQSSTLTGTGSHDVILSWTASPSSGVEGYNVYRGTTSGGESSTPLNSTPINGTTYVDANVAAGSTYYYVVTAVGSDGEQSAASNETEATVPTP